MFDVRPRGLVQLVGASERSAVNGSSGKPRARVRALPPAAAIYYSQLGLEWANMVASGVALDRGVGQRHLTKVADWALGKYFGTGLA